jgi:hypothetical protein
MQRLFGGSDEMERDLIVGPMSTATEGDRAEDKNCEALYQSTLQTCASLSGRKRFACFEAARENRDQCYREKGKEPPE